MVLMPSGTCTERSVSYYQTVIAFLIVDYKWYPLMEMWHCRSHLAHICCPLVYTGACNTENIPFENERQVHVFTLAFSCSIICKLAWDAVCWQSALKCCGILFTAVRDFGGGVGLMWFSFLGEGNHITQ